MRHRIGIAATTGLGDPSPALLNNVWPTDRRLNSLVRRCLSDAVDKYLTKDYVDGDISAWCDFGLSLDGLLIGQEPAYFGDDLTIVCIARKKENSYIRRGHAFGYYGSGIRSTYRFYKNYKYNSKFIRFVDRWHPLLFAEAKRES